MNNTQGHSLGFYPLLLGTMVALSCSTLQAQSRQELEEAQARFKQEMANCVSGNTNQDKDSCMREARAALAEVKRGVPDRPGKTAGKLEADTRQRGEGSATGNVEGGGTLREIPTPAPAP